MPSLTLSFGALAPPLSEQLAAQGFTLEDAHIERLQKMADAATVLAVHAFLTDREAQRVRKRIQDSAFRFGLRRAPLNEAAKVVDEANLEPGVHAWIAGDLNAVDALDRGLRRHRPAGGVAGGLDTTGRTQGGQGPVPPEDRGEPGQRQSAGGRLDR